MSLFLKNLSGNPISVSLIAVLIIFSCQSILVSSFEYQVGGREGWAVPTPNATKTYNDWASEKRFQVGDIIRFKYKKDSVMEVSGDDYRTCNSTHPRFFSNTGNSVFRLHYSGPFYFISGMSGHCKKGQKIVIKVISGDNDHDDETSGSSSVSPDAVLSICFGLVLFFHSVFSSVVASYCIF